MKKLFTLFFAALTTLSASALDDGFYRMQCVETGRYVSFRNSYVDTQSAQSTQEVQFYSLRTVSGFENVVSDPGSIIYIKKFDQGYALRSQGYGTDESNYYIQITDMGDGSYRLWATYSKSGVTVTRYMRDCDDSSGGFSYVTTQESISKGLNWRLIPVNSEDQKYIGLVPEVKVGGKGYATFYAGIPYKLGSGMKAYTVDTETDETCTLKDIGSEIPAKTPVVIACAGDNAADNKVTPLESSSASVGTNYLKGVMFCYPVTYYNRGEIVEDRTNPYWNTVDYDIFAMRVLGEEDGKLVFETGDEDLDYMPANKAYLSVPFSAAAVLTTDGSTAIKGVKVSSTSSASSTPSGTYTLDGVRLPDNATLQKGVYIKDGKKIVIP
jgi:hypothetical protein